MLKPVLSISFAISGKVNHEPRTFRLTGLVLVFALLFSGGSGAVAPAPAIPQAKSAQDKAPLAQTLGQLPLIFIQNQGQMDSRVAYYLQGQDTTIYFASDGLTFALAAPITNTTSSSPVTSLPFAIIPKKLKSPPEKTNRWILKLDFLGANPGVIPQGEDRAETTVSYFDGSPDQWHTGLPTFHRLVYHDLWPGIDLVYSGSADQMKYEFIVKPGADPRQIRLAYRGASALKLDSAGKMEVSTPFGSLQDEAPLAYMVSRGNQVPVAAHYQVQNPLPSNSGLLPLGGSSAENVLVYSFKVADYDSSLQLVIDPAVLVYCGYIGGSGNDWGYGIAVDGNGAAYVTGWTASNQTTFPVTAGPDLTQNGGTDAFVAKVRPDGKGLVYAGYIGGSGDDWGYDIAVDESGAAYITGATSSDQTSFPVTGGPDLTYNGGDYDAFVAKVRPDGTGLVYAGYIGGSGDDLGFGIAVEGSGAAYITGATSSDQTSFPVTGGPDLTYNGGNYDAFVAKVSPDGTGLVYAGYIGGSGNDWGYGIAVDETGAAYVTGSTNSDQTTFPVTIGPDLTYNGNNDAYIAKVRPDGTGLVYAGYIGGSGYDLGYGIAVDGSGASYVTGLTNSDQASFPVIIGPDLTYNGGSYDAFVAKVRPDGTGLVYAGYIGGSGDDGGHGIAVDGSGAAYVTGHTSSDQTTFPVTAGPGLIYNGGFFDAFVAKVRPDGTGLVYAGYIGGSGTDEGYGLAVDKSGAAYITGGTSSDQTTFPVTAGPDLTYNGGDDDAFVAKIGIESQLFFPVIKR